MALCKSITLDNGVVLNYHRVSSVTLSLEEHEVYPELPEVEEVSENEVETIAEESDSSDQEVVVPEISKVLKLYVEVESYV